METRVFDRYRLKDYADCLWRNGLRLPGCCGFVDGTFHKTYRPGADGYNGLLQRVILWAGFVPYIFVTPHAKI